MFTSQSGHSLLIERSQQSRVEDVFLRLPAVVSEIKLTGTVKPRSGDKEAQKGQIRPQATAVTSKFRKNGCSTDSAVPAATTSCMLAETNFF